jgi:hypothetical protein
VEESEDLDASKPLLILILDRTARERVDGMGFRVLLRA